MSISSSPGDEAQQLFRRPAAFKDSGSAEKPRKQADQADDDEIEGDDVVEQARHDEDQNAGNQRHQRSEGNVNHVDSLSRPAASISAPHPAAVLGEAINQAACLK